MMGREKLLWGGAGALIAAVLTYALLLLFSVQPMPNGEEGTEPSPDANMNESRTAGPSVSEDASDPVARVGSVLLPRDEFIDGIVLMYGDEFIQDWMKRTAVKLEARELGINVQRQEIDRELRRMQSGYDSEEQFYRTMEEQLGLTVEELRAEALFRLQLEKIAVSGVVVPDSELERYIDEHPEQYGPQLELKIAQIIVPTEEEANSVISKLSKGADFEQLAREQSIDPETAASGGDLGWVSVYDPFLPQELLETAGQMPTGGISSPIPLGGSGYAVILLEGKREIKMGSKEQIREEARWELLLAKSPPVEDVLNDLLKRWDARSLINK